MIGAAEIAQEEELLCVGFCEWGKVKRHWKECNQPRRYYGLAQLPPCRVEFPKPCHTGLSSGNRNMNLTWPWGKKKPKKTRHAETFFSILQVNGWDNLVLWPFPGAELGTMIIVSRSACITENKPWRGVEASVGKFGGLAQGYESSGWMSTGKLTQVVSWFIWQWFLRWTIKSIQSTTNSIFNTHRFYTKIKWHKMRVVERRVCQYLILGQLRSQKRIDKCSPSFVTPL